MKEEMRFQVLKETMIIMTKDSGQKSTQVATVLEEKSDAHINVVLVRKIKVLENFGHLAEENPEFLENN